MFPAVRVMWFVGISWLRLFLRNHEWQGPFQRKLLMFDGKAEKLRRNSTKRRGTTKLISAFVCSESPLLIHLLSKQSWCNSSSMFTSVKFFWWQRNPKQSLVIASLKYSNYHANWNVHPCRVKLPSSGGDHQSPSRIPIQLPMLNKNRVGELERFH